MHNTVSLTKNNNLNDKLLFIVVFIAVLFSSMVGAQLWGISLNKLALLPLELYCLFHVLKHRKIIIASTSTPLICFYFAQIVGSFIALLNHNYLSLYSNYRSTLQNNIIQNVFIYLPLVFSLSVLDNKDKLLSYLKRSLIYTCRIHCVWAIAQFVLWYAISFDFNNFVFVDLLNGLLGDNYKTFLIFLDGKTQLRATGLNYEPAAMATIMLLGVCLEKTFLLKLIYCATCFLGMSRTGIIVTFGTLGFQIIYTSIKHRKNFDKKLLKKALFYLAGAIVFVLVCLSIDFLRTHILNALSRFMNMGNRQDGTSRHLMYPIYSLYAWFNELNIAQKTFGIGARVSGLAFSNSEYISSQMILNQTMKTTAWEIECDFAAILLGDGLIGIIAYFALLVGLIKKKELGWISLGVGLFVYGVMYNTFSQTLMQIILITLFSTSKKENEPLPLLKKFYRKTDYHITF